MHAVALADSFIDSLARLDPSDVKRAAAFVDKLVRDPAAPGLQPEIVHDAADRTIRSFRVTHDLRAIVHVDGERLLLLFVARHDVAYEWARGRCIECHPVTGEIQVVADPTSAARRLAETGAVAEAQRIAGGAEPPAGLFDGMTDEALVALGVPTSWVATIRMVRSADMLLAIAEDLPAHVADRLLALATGEPVSVGDRTWLCDVANSAALCRLLEQNGIEHGLEA